MSGEWESDRRAGWRRALVPAALVVTGLLVGVVSIPASPEPTLPIHVDPPIDVDPPTPPPARVENDADGVAAGRWATMSAGPLSTRQRVTSAWTGDELLVWGGRVASRGRWFADGAAYDPATDEWRRLPRSPLRARAGASGVWSGTEFIIWGGAGAADDASEPRGVVGGRVETARTTQAFADGAAYNPRTNRWRRLAPSPLAPRRDAPMVWTGGKVVVWGGTGITTTEHEPDGARYDPATDRWEPMRAGPLGRGSNSLVQAVALDGRALFWASDLATARAAVYNPAVDDWQRISPPPVDPGVVPSMATVAGGVVLWGGWRSSRGDDRPVAVRYTTATNRWITVSAPPYAPARAQPLAAAGATAIASQAGSGVVYDGVRDRWDELPEGPILHPDALHTWTGNRLLLWSPGGSQNADGRAAAWIPRSPWRRLSQPPAAIDAGGTAVWSGWLEQDQQVLLWGGVNHGSPDVGAAYDPAARLWETLPRPPLSRRVEPASAWFAPEMIVVGGRDLADAPALREAAAYNPRTRHWRRLPDAPMAVAGDGVTVGGDRVYAAGLRGGDVMVAAYLPARERWEELPPPPIHADVDRLHVAWTDFELWVWGTHPDGDGAGAAWSPRRGRWRPLPPLSGVAGQVAWSWATSRVFVLAQDGTTASLGRGGVEWRRYARSPIRSRSAATAWNGQALLAFAPFEGDMAALEPSASEWAAYPDPRLPRHRDGRLLWTGRDMFAFAGKAGATLAR